MPKVTAGGGGSLLATFENITLKDYEAKIREYEEKGFKVYAENKEGIGGTVFSVTLTKEVLVLTIAYYALEEKMSVAVYEGTPSEFLLPPMGEGANEPHDKAADESCEKSGVTGKEAGVRKNRLHMLELWAYGNSFVFELKNGHFIISDGGTPRDLPYLLDYLESLTPEGEKPIIDAWVLSHGHGDHVGALGYFMEHGDWLQRIRVEGVYFTEPSERVVEKCGGELNIARVKWITKNFLRSNGEKCHLYRMQTGQRYYFNDVTMDILLCPEQVPFEEFKRDLNTSSTVCLFTVDGQKCFFGGDVHQEGLSFIMNNYTKEFMDLTLYTLNHHGFNTSLEFADFATYHTILVTLRDTLPIRMLRETKYLLSKAEENLWYGDGSKILTFPYIIGSYETLPNLDWKYDDVSTRPCQPNLYTFPGRRLVGFLFDGDDCLGEDMIGFLSYINRKGARLAVFSRNSVEELKEKLSAAGILDLFELVMGDVSSEKAMDIMEEKFQLDKVHKYVIVCSRIDVVREAVSKGLRTLIFAEGKEISEEMKYKSWQVLERVEDYYQFEIDKKILYE